MKLAEKADILDLDDLLDHSAKPKLAHKSIRKSEKSRKPKAREVLRPYIPPPMPPDLTPDAVILYWRKTTCTCGATYEGPRYFPNSTFYRVKLPTRVGLMEKWDFIPKYLSDQYPDLPHLTDIEAREVTNCQKCHGHSCCPPAQAHLQFEPDREETYYGQKLNPAQYPAPSLNADLCPTYDPSEAQDFKQLMQTIIDNWSTETQVKLGHEIGKSIFANLTQYITLIPKGT